MSGVFLNCFSPYSLRYCLSLNQELTDLAFLASQLTSDPLCQLQSLGAGYQPHPR